MERKVRENNFIKFIVDFLKSTFLAKRNTKVNFTFLEWQTIYLFIFGGALFVLAFSCFIKY